MPPGPAPGPSPGLSAGGACVHVDSYGFSLEPLERSPGSWHYLSAQQPPHSSKLRALAASRGPWPAAGTASLHDLTSVDDDPVAQGSIATLRCRGNTMMAGHCQVPACCLSCLAWVFQGLSYTSEHLTLSSQDFAVSQGRAVVREMMFSTHPALSSHWGLQPGRRWRSSHLETKSRPCLAQQGLKFTICATE